MKKISIVTISYNQDRFLNECMSSVLCQNRDDDQYIIVDPGSTDGSRETISKLAQSNCQVLLEPDHGPPDGLNKGFAMADGEIFCYLNSDDVLLPGALASVRDIFEDDSVDIVIGNGCIIDENSRVTSLVRSCPNISPYRYLIGASVALQQATFFRADAFRAVGGFNVNNKSCWDGELLLQMLSSGFKYKYADEFLGAFRIYNESITGSQRLNQLYLADKERMFLAALGRPRNIIDDAFAASLRLRNRILRAVFEHKHRGFYATANISRYKKNDQK